MSSENIPRRIAIVTGAAQADGLAVVVSDIAAKQSLLDAVCDEIRASHPDIPALAIATDVSSEKDVTTLVEETVAKLGGLDVMVANAGVCWMTPILETSVEDINKMFSINFTGTVFCYKAAAKKGFPMMSTYGATKAAIRVLTQSAAAEFGSHGITVNAYAPGAVITPMSEIPSRNRYYVAQTSVKRIGDPVDVANLVSFLASEQSSYISGQTVTIDGGVWFD
ncbi:short chain oxidoreductase [Pleurotus eryngii]|uniref:Short chain oxidoreductase n=1 Tax=Pleurotus eryngii TaxID=5323 RepID=A0A9P5ZWB2_PLEER|nr:short chain oxidoreductase [Pleurotus eryngii]